MTTEPAARGWLCDVNVLVALALQTHLHHLAAHAALRSHGGTWATCPVTESALVRLLVNPRVVPNAFTAPQVWATLRGMRDDPRWRFVADDASLVDASIDTTVVVGHQQVTDVQLVNLAASAGLVLATFDAGIPASLAPPDRRHVHVLAQ
ncbi:MAG: TA system VapC family ribonuclease toxin [Dermatophilaceae bacterium]